MPIKDRLRAKIIRKKGSEMCARNKGMMIDENEVELDLKLKESFKNKQFYKTGLVYKNEKQI